MSVYKEKIWEQGALSGKQFEGDIFLACRMTGVKLKFSAFTKCRFERCDFGGVMFDGTSFEECSFPESKLSYLDFGPVTFVKCDFRKAVIQNAVFQKRKTGSKDELTWNNLRECLFGEAELSNSIFVKCNLEGADFTRAKLTGAAFDRSNLRKAKLTGADISGTSFEGSTVDKTELDYQGFVQYGNSRGFVLGQSRDTENESD